jgi:hypothetical protein
MNVTSSQYHLLLNSEISGFHGGALIMEAASTSEKSVNFYQTTRRNIPEESHLQHTTIDSNRNN